MTIALGVKYKTMSFIKKCIREWLELSTASMRQLYIFICILLFCSVTALVSAQNWLIGDFISPDYDSTQPPLINGYVPVDGSVVLSRIAAASDQRSLNVHIMLCLKWYDYRLRNVNPTIVNETNHIELLRYTSVRSTDFSQFWLPKLIFRNGLSYSVVHSLQNIQFVEVWPETKMISMCSRLSVQLICVFDLGAFPFDGQECLIELQSAGNTVQHLQITMSSWKSITRGNNQFRVHHLWNGSCQHMDPDLLTALPSAQADSCAYVGIKLVRHISYYIIRYYTSTFLCLVCSFCSFWVATNGWPARVILTCVVYLTLKAISETAYDEVPAPDVVPLFWWLWVIQFFIYMNLIEYAMALAWVQFAQDKERAHAANRPSPDGHYFGKNGWYRKGGLFVDQVLHRFFGPIDFFREPQGRNKVDYVARILMPAIMFVFVLIYIVANIPAWAVMYL